MGASREGANIWWLLFHHPRWIKKRTFTSPYFWHDSFGKFWFRLIVCRFFGHNNIQDTGVGRSELHCFNCEKTL